MRLVLVQPQLDHSEAADNIAAVSRSLAAAGITPLADDVLLLPERVMMTHAREQYVRTIEELARALGCNVVGGSHHEARGGELVNAGIAVGPDGARLGEYEKVRPYASERAGVRGGPWAAGSRGSAGIGSSDPPHGGAGGVLFRLTAVRTGHPP